VLPLHLLLTTFSMSLIIIGSNRSAWELIKAFKRVHVDKDSSDDKNAGPETMTKEDAK